MKKIFLFIFLLPSLSFAQLTKAQLDTEADSIKNEPIARNNNAKRLARMWKNQNASFLNPTNGDILPKVNGGTGTSSPSLIAGTNVTITGSWPNQTINSSGGGGGITNSAANNELMKSNGTNAVASGFFSPVTGDLIFGSSSLSGGTRQLSVDGSSSNVSLSITPKGTGGVTLYNSTQTNSISVISTQVSIGNNSGGNSLIMNNFQNQLIFTSASTNAVQYPLTLITQSSGTPAIGIGSGVQFETPNSSNTFKIGNTIESISTSVTPSSESFDLVFRGMTSGSTSEKFRLTSYGALLTGSTAFSTVALGSVGSSQNDYNIGNGTVFYITPTAGINITGIANTTDGRVIYITNLSGSFGIGFPDNSGSSSAGNRFSIPGSFTLAAGNTCQFVYVSGAWRLAAKTN